MLLLSMPYTKAAAQPPQGSGYSTSTTSPASSASIPPEYRPHISPKAIAYQRKGRILSLLHMIWSLLGLWLFLQSGAARILSKRVGLILHIRQPNAAKPPAFIPLTIYLALFSMALWAWSLPFDVAGLYLERQYGFGTETSAGLLCDGLIAQAFGLLMAPLIWAAYRIHSRFTRTWWLWVWGFSAPLLYVIVVLEPIVFAPMFNRYTPMPSSPVKADILILADQAGVHNAAVLIENTSTRTRHVNAYVTGIGPSARIVINDTAIQELPEDQLLAMIGHELGHYVEHHIMIGYVCSVLGSGIFLWICSYVFPWITERHPLWGSRGIYDLAMLPALMLFISLFLVVQSPIENAISRTLEHRADAFGLRLTRLNSATARLMLGFAERDYSDPDPPKLLHFWFGSHPTLNERIAFALSYGRQR
jgi:STE24 endopeptidase